MAKNSVPEWDTSPSGNSDIGGTNIAVGCPPSDVGIFMRTSMAQIATWIASATGPLMRTAANAIANAVKIGDGQTSPTDRYIGYRSLPFTASTTGRTLVLTDVGMCIPTTGAITVPPNSSVAFAIGDTVSVYNNSAGNITLTQGSGVTIRLVGTSTTGNRTLAQRGIATLLKVATDEWVATGGGVS